MKRVLSAAAALYLSFGAVAEAPDELLPIPTPSQLATGVQAREQPSGNACRTECIRKRGVSRGLMPRPSFSQGVGTAADLAALIDGTLCEQFGETCIAGAAVAVVDHGEVAFSSGYFYSDYAAQTLVDPTETMFRIGSISKLFTWTSVMQLAEQGRVSLTADVNDYLVRFKIPADFAQPITLKNLMTHTAGFEENIVGIGRARGWADLPTLEQTVEGHVPARVRPPATDFMRGEEAAYSNWGAALAGYIVAQRSGIPFDDYIDDHIFDPLDMKHSSFRESPQPDPRISEGYGFEEDGTAVPCGFQYLHGLGPAGSGSVSAEDMARFVAAHLQNGSFDGRTILKEETARLMHSKALSPHPHLTGATYGFNEHYLNGRRLLSHGGLTRCFYSELYLFPGESIGLFVTYNTRPLGRHVGQLAQRFMDRYFQAPAEPLPFSSSGSETAPGGFTGYYQTNSRARETWERLFSISASFAVTVTDQGTLYVPAPGAKTFEWLSVPESPGLLRGVDGKGSLAVLENARGDAYILGQGPFAPWVRLHFLERPDVNGYLVAICLVGFAFAILLWLFADKLGWDCDRNRAVVSLPAILGLVNAGILLGLWLAWKFPTGDLLTGIPRSVRVSMGLSWLSALLTALLALAIAHGWLRQDWTPRARTAFTTLALPDFVFLAWLCFWSLLSTDILKSAN